MFLDARSKRIVLVAHCILNQNAISDGTAQFPGADAAVVRRLLEAGVGIVQLPCPELNCLGLDRGDPRGGERHVLEENTRIREAMERTAPARILSSLVEHVAFAVEEYRRHGFAIVGLIGIDRSPSCGVNTMSRFVKEQPGRGVFVDALRNEFSARGLHVDMIGIKASEPEQASERVAELLRSKP